MPRKKSRESSSPLIPTELLDSLVKGPMSAEGVAELMGSFKKALMERVLTGEMRHHLGYGPGESKPAQQSNHRNGTSPKTVLTDTGAVRIEVPRDREGTFEPQLIGKHERRFQGFDDKILGMYARGMTVREIQSYLLEMYATQVSADFISSVTDEVMGEVMSWQSRPLERMYPVVMFDAVRVKIRDEGVVRSKAVYLALGVLADGTKDILGIWIEATEGAKFWLRVFNDLKIRGCQDILIAVTDGLSGMEEALSGVYPSTTLQTCVVHLIRNSLSYVGWKDRRALAAALKPIYKAVNAEVAKEELETFAQSAWGRKFPTIAPSWRRAWDKVIPFLAFPPEVRRVLYTTNALESVNARVRRVIKTRGHFPNDAAATKLIWLALRSVIAKWSQPDHHWRPAMTQFAILYDHRFTRSVAGR